MYLVEDISYYYQLNMYTTLRFGYIYFILLSPKFAHNMVFIFILHSIFHSLYSYRHIRHNKHPGIKVGAS